MKPTLGCTTRPFGKVGFVEAFERIAAAGFSEVAVFANVGIDSASSDEHATEVKAAAEDLGLRVSMLLARAELDTRDAMTKYRRLIDRAAVLGASWLLDLGAGNPDDFDRYVELMKNAAPYAQDAGVRISAKPHGGITRTSEDLLSLNARVGHPSYGICFDPGNIIYYTRGAERPETNLAEVAPAVTTCIIKDCVLRDGEPDVMITPGEGLVDFDTVLGVLARGGFRGPLYLECVGGATVEEVDANVRKTREMIEGVLATL